MVKGGFELFREDRGIIGGDAEGDSGTDVTENGVADGVSHLGDVLVGNSEIKTVFASFGEDYSEGIGGKVLELVDVKIEGATVGDIRNIGAGHGGELNFGNKESTKDASVIFTDETLG